MYGRKSSGPRIPQTAGGRSFLANFNYLICLIKRKRTTSEQKEEKQDLIYCEIFDLQFQVPH